MMMVEYIEVTVGKLPEWYDEGEHDLSLEGMIEQDWRKNYQYRDATIRVLYSYDGASTVAGWNDAGDVAFERDTDLSEHFARLRVQGSDALAPHAEFILADWNEPDHAQWVAEAEEQEILDWVEAGKVE